MRFHLHASGTLAYTTDNFRTSERYTDEPPPEVGPRQIARYTGEAWEVVSDWRGVTLYDTATGQPTRITSIDVAPADLQLTDLVPPPFHTWLDGAWVPPSEEQRVHSLKAAALASIDSAADECRMRVVGDSLRVVEYQRAADEAQHLLDTGEALPAVSAWAAAKGWTNLQAAQNILDESRSWNGVLYAIRDIRLAAKESVRVAPVEQVTSISESARLQLFSLIAGVGNAQPPT